MTTITITRAPNIFVAEDCPEYPGNTQGHEKKVIVSKHSFKNTFLKGEINLKK